MTMEIQLLDTGGKFLCILNNEDALLGAYPVDDNMRLHVGTLLLYHIMPDILLEYDPTRFMFPFHLTHSLQTTIH